eukprot:scaffold324871_cov34-Prasinocladus_malaysianus.AAC.1
MSTVNVSCDSLHRLNANKSEQKECRFQPGDKYHASLGELRQKIRGLGKERPNERIKWHAHNL